MMSAFQLFVTICFAMVAMPTMARCKSVQTIYAYQNYGEEKVININGKPFDFNTAEVVEKTANYETYQAKDDPSVKITKYKNGGISVVSTGDAVIQITSGSDVLVSSDPDERAKAAQEAVDKALAQIDKIFGGIGWPFVRRENTPEITPPDLPQIELESTDPTIELLD